MSRSAKTTRRNSSATTSRNRPASMPVIDSESLECIELFASLLVRCSFPRDRAIEHFKYCLEHLPREMELSEGSPDSSDEDPLVPAEVLTRWHLLRQYVGRDGLPLALRAKGKGPTFASLVHLVDPRANPQRILEYLLSIRALTRIGQRYLPRERKARHRLSTRMLRIFNLRATLALLRVSESNIREGRARHYQFTADGSVPEHRLAAFREAMAELGDATLLSADEEMLRESSSGLKGSRPIPMTLGCFLSEGRPLPSMMPQNTAAPVAAKTTRRR